MQDKSTTFCRFPATFNCRAFTGRQLGRVFLRRQPQKRTGSRTAKAIPGENSQFRSTRFVWIITTKTKRRGPSSAGSKKTGNLFQETASWKYICPWDWGSPDGKPDMINGVLQEMENFRHCRDCISLRFKQLKIEGKPLKPREIFMLDEMASKADPVDQDHCHRHEDLPQHL